MASGSVGGNGRRTEITGTGGWRILKLSRGKFPSKVGGKDRGKVLLGLPSLEGGGEDDNINPLCSLVSN